MVTKIKVSSSTESAFANFPLSSCMLIVEDYASFSFLFFCFGGGWNDGFGERKKRYLQCSSFIVAFKRSLLLHISSCW